ncbi:MAG: response regulator transcription factor [Clostridia bacterium]|nr:response regulator transcription factor [Clostridia bacterium]MBQ6708036.1 response regulator transcription factor [Clostridia bacterium]
MKKIIIADDEENLRRLLCDFLKREGYEPIEAEDGIKAMDVFYQNPDAALMILDIMMPGYDGWEVCRKIKEISDMPIIMLTARSQDFDELESFESGADDFVTKPVSLMVLLKRIEILLKHSAREIRKTDDLELDGLVIDEKAHTVTLKGEMLELTLKEYGLLIKLMSNKGRVFTREHLLDNIWGYDYEGDMRTVDSHVTRLRTKLGEWGYEHLKTVYGIGYKIEVGMNE